MKIELTNTAKKLCIIGDPVTHSKSPLLQNAMCQALDLDYIYLCQPVKPEGLEDFLAAAKALGYAGFNATMPFKELLIPYLDELDPVSKKLGAVNTVCIKNGKLYGYNTDCPGYVAALLAAYFDPRDKAVLLLGAGGAAKAVAVGLAGAGARSITVANRTREKAEMVAGLIPGQGSVTDWSVSALSQAAGQCDLLVNATSLGMAGQGEFDDLTFLEALPRGALVSDLIYHPAETLLLRRAKALGYRTLNGIPLLVHQAILALEKFTGTRVPPAVAIPVVTDALRSKR